MRIYTPSLKMIIISFSPIKHMFCVRKSYAPKPYIFIDCYLSSSYLNLLCPKLTEIEITRFNCIFFKIAHSYLLLKVCNIFVFTSIRIQCQRRSHIIRSGIIWFKPELMTTAAKHGC